ncbi:cutinase family protein [Aldersonia sp. NBC_00410]|uniref:cutinase family protein n=1 Tax=Aldersonia sp. NBC_00410 TaxID=2975954 RepID=UPI002255949A|nr:cutinase family protein [Aldersonia sp. NBC_00410]MCX5045634.1 cutinase family protein [Aldersonia sp. NBC_00410]
MGVAVLVATPFLSQSTPDAFESVLTGAGAPGCYDMVSIAIGGRGDVPSSNANNQYIVAADGTVLPAAKAGNYSSNWVDPVVNAPTAAVGSDSYAAIYVDYPANMASYEDAVDAGVANSKTVMKSIAKECPNTKFSVVGYSEGADVARRLAMDVGNQEAGDITIVDPNSVVGVVILADAGRAAGEGPFPGAKDPYANPDGFNVAYQNGTTVAPGQGALQGTGGSFGALNGKVASFCSEGDLTCSLPESTSVLQLAVNVARQVNVDSLQKDGLTVANGPQVAAVIGRIALAALNEIATQDDWMKSDQTFLDVLIKVSDPYYEPKATATAGELVQFTTGELLNVAYLPKKMANEVIGAIEDNKNTIAVVQSDPYNLTLGPDTGHHFDYWHDTNAADGKNMTSAQYAATWLTQLAEQAQNGQPSTTEVPDAVGLAATMTASATATPTTAPKSASTTASSAQKVASTKSSEQATTTGAPTTTDTTQATSTSEATATTTTEQASTTDATTEAPAEVAGPVDVVPSVKQVAAGEQQAVRSEGEGAEVTTTTPVPAR